MKNERGSMQQVVAVIKPFKVEDVKEALNKIGITGMTVSEVEGYGRQKGHKEIYRGAEYETNFLPKIELKIVVEAERADEVATAIIDAAGTGNIGDGKIFIMPVQKVIRIRTGETGAQAL